MKTLTTIYTIFKILFAFIVFVIVMTILFCGYAIAIAIDKVNQKFERKKIILVLHNWFHIDSGTRHESPAGWHVPIKKDMKKLKSYESL